MSSSLLQRWRLFLFGITSALSLMGLVLLGSVMYAHQKRTQRSRQLDEVKQRRQRAASRARSVQSEVVRGLTKNATLEVRDHGVGRLDLLVISAGAQYGAFGAGVLEGWRMVQGSTMAIPQFDLVTGVSAGALLASSALVADPPPSAREEPVETLFLRARDSWSFDQAWSYLPWTSSLLSVEPLTKGLTTAIGKDLLQRVAKSARENRLVLIMATNLDLGVPEVFNLSSMARRAQRSSTPERILRAYRLRIRAAASPPPLFPAVEIDSMLYADGGASHPFFLGPRLDFLQSLRRTLSREGIAHLVDLRIWVIINSPLWPEPDTIADRYPSLALRAVRLSSYTAIRTELNRMQANVAHLAAEGIRSAELRYVAVPSELDAKGNLLLSRRFVRRLRDTGKRFGAEPASWNQRILRLRSGNAP
ncbi:MAG: patatin-like phospholipase family protein [Myxococcota bacterium]